MKKHWPIMVILLVFAAAVGLEVGWGLPGPERARLLFPSGAPEGVFDEIAARSQDKLAAQQDEPIPLYGQRPGRPTYDRDEALDACRRFLLYSDQPNEILSLMALARMRPEKLQLDPHMGQYGGAFLYPLAAWLKLATLTPWVSQRSLAEYLREPEAFGRVYVAARLFVALCVAAGIVVVYLIGLRLGGVTAASAAAGLLAFSPAVLTWSVVINPHAAAILPAALALYWALGYYEWPRRRTLVLSALAAGVAAGMTLVAAPVLLAPLAAVWLARHREGWRLPRSLACLAAAGAAFIACNPYHVIAFADRLREMEHVRDFYTGAVTPWRWLEFLGGPMREAASAVFLAVGLAAAALLVAREARRAAILFLPLAAALVALPLMLRSEAGEPQSARFALPVLGAVFLAVGWGLDHLSRPDASTASRARAVPALLLLMLALSASTVYVHFASAMGGNPRYDAGCWLNEHPGLPILVEYPPAPYRAPPLAYLEREVLFEPDPSRACVAVSATWRVAGEVRNRPNVWVFSLDGEAARPWWLRAPMSFADSKIVLEYRAAQE